MTVIMDVKATVTASVFDDTSILRGNGISNHSSVLAHPRCSNNPFSLPHDPDAAAASPAARCDADKLEPGPPRHDDDGAAVFGADGPDGAVGVGLEEIDAVWGRGFDLDG
ncbi:uncharacterized protein TrAFT101_009259 [Trichoderma asperellum]|uniref:uncharacterized protein n=1 Tax=Trichoderma asperellum TaxID=101201 RepID=UPI003316E71B|nr:hypothetical protein TrAFT101_009259 [Trichoderma asperellum]